MYVALSISIFILLKCIHLAVCAFYTHTQKYSCTIEKKNGRVSERDTKIYSFCERKREERRGRVRREIHWSEYSSVYFSSEKLNSRYSHGWLNRERWDEKKRESNSMLRLQPLHQIAIYILVWNSCTKWKNYFLCVYAVVCEQCENRQITLFKREIEIFLFVCAWWWCREWKCYFICTEYTKHKFPIRFHSTFFYYLYYKFVEIDFPSLFIFSLWQVL